MNFNWCNFLGIQICPDLVPRRVKWLLKNREALWGNTLLGAVVEMALLDTFNPPGSGSQEWARVDSNGIQILSGIAGL